MVSSQRLRCVVQGLSGRLLLALLLCVYPWQACLAQQRDDQHVLVLGRISDDPRQHHGQLKPLLDYVVQRMADVGITEGRILMARDAQQMASYLRRGRVDWVSETSGGAVLLAERSGAEPLLLTERNGVAQYHSVFFVRRDSTLSGLAQLRGKRLAVQGAMSTSAYMVPLTTLLANGVQPEILMGPDDVPAADRVGYVYARSERNIATWVQRGLVDVGVFSNIDWDNQEALPPGIRRDLRIIHRTESFPRALELVRADLPVAVRERLREVLLEASKDPAAAPALRQFFGTSAFARVDRGSQARLDELRSGLRRVRMEVE
ncbi:metal-binding protein [Stenotrophomonas ginsengisoli]|uniref:Metal-binding protein n=1 Tax=Stenotrophomonas ginsengisoli TaxID=336566 RepID=A0A0R0DKU5_9GAMM|nr:phosphate/phosphite/phosphonate ABC transporter substrate-binding protein [Stenotrophomonas ginsengisoli]KRG78865.1 metal-binding protein [Stenotrophomonas ginsengisoli]